MPAPRVRRLGLVSYESTWQEMKQFTAQRGPHTADELWLLEHAPVYTYGIAGRQTHLPDANSPIPVIHVDRGGQVTYHGPGQLVVYVLWDLSRAHLGVRQTVRRLEQAVIDLLALNSIHAVGREDAPGVYVNGAKVASLGLKIRKGCCYHGLSLNVDMDLTPFTHIDPCGYPELRVTQLRDLGVVASKDVIGEQLLRQVQFQMEARA